MSYKVYDDVAKRLELYERRLHRACDKYDEWLPGAKRRYERYRGTLLPTQVNAHGHRISTPTGTATIDALFASLTAVEVDISCTPLASGTRDQAYLAQHALRHEWRLSRVQRKSEKALKDALITDIGWVKVSYDYSDRDEEQPRHPDDMEADIQSIFAGADPENLPDADEVAAQVDKTEVVTVIERDRIVVDYVPFESLRWDSMAKSVEEIRWYALITKMTKEEIEDNDQWREWMKQYGTLNKLESLAPDQTLAKSLNVLTDPDGEDDLFEVIEYWDLETGTFCCFVRKSDFLLYEGPNQFAVFPDFIDRTPFWPCVLREDPENVRGIADMRLMQPILEELDLYRSNLATYTDRYVPKMLHENGAFTESGKVALASREYGVGVELEAGHTVDQVKEMSPPALPAEIFQVPDRLENEIREATGVNELMRGIFPDRKRTATETQQVVAASAGRQAEKRNRLGEFYRGIAKRMLRLMQMNYDQERVARVVDQYGEIEWTWDKYDITLDADIEISLTPLEEKTMQQRKEDAIALANLLGPLPIVDQGALIRYILEETGLTRELVAEIVKTPEQEQVDKQSELQLQAEQQAVAEGAMPNPTNVPGPYSGADLAAGANAGEIPPSVAAGAAGAAPGSEDVIAQLLQ